jgi:hypothetical protein
MEQSLFNILIAIIGALGGWWMKVMHESLRDLQREDKQLGEKVSKIEVLVAGNYVPKSEFTQTISALFTKLDRIEDKLDGKVDK